MGWLQAAAAWLERACEAFWHQAQMETETTRGSVEELWGGRDGWRRLRSDRPEAGVKIFALALLVVITLQKHTS